MSQKHSGTVVFQNPPRILSASAVGGKKEVEGPLSKYFDATSRDTKFGQTSWEQAEQKMQTIAMSHALQKAKKQPADVDFAFAGDLLNQCITSSFALRDSQIPTVGLYGACSTMAEGLALAAMTVSGGFADTALAMTSSHFAAAERQYRFPLVYGGQRPPYSQWTVTGAGCALVGNQGTGTKITAATFGKILDWGIKDANNMGAAMAPASVILGKCPKTPKNQDFSWFFALYVRIIAYFTFSRKYFSNNFRNTIKPLNSTRGSAADFRPLGE